MAKIRVFLIAILSLILICGNQDVSASSVDSCQGVKSAIKRARAKLFTNQNLFPKTAAAKKKNRKIVKRIKHLKAIKVSQGCFTPDSIVIVEPPQSDELCVQMIVCRIVDSEVVVWPNPCIASKERPDYQSLPFC
jgi:hypothetical protein